MKRSEALPDKLGRPVKYAADPIHRHFQSVRGDLREGGFETLPDGRAADKYRDPAIGLEQEPRMLARAGRTALDKAADPQPVITPVDQPPLKFGPLRPTDLLEATIEGQPIIATVERVLVFVGSDVAIE